MQQARNSFGVAVVEGKIYVIGGEYGMDFLGSNECYDPKADVWVALVPMPTARAGFAVVVYEEKIYCIGGRIGANFSGVNSHYYEPPPPVKFSVNEVYDPVTDSWSTKASMPISESDLQAYVVDGKIFVIDVYGNLFMYNPADDLWTKKTSAPVPSYSSSSASSSFLGFSTMVNNKIIVYHEHYLFSEFSGKFLVYDPKTNKWSDKNTPSFMPENSTSSAPFKGRGFTGVTSGVYAPQGCCVFSANLYGSVSNEVLFYDSVGDVWLFGKGMPTNRWHFGVAVVDDIFYAIGGLIDGPTGSACAVNEQYIPIGYQSTPITPKPTETPHVKPADSSKNFLIYLTITVLSVIVGVVVVGLFFCFRKSKRGVW